MTMDKIQNLYSHLKHENLSDEAINLLLEMSKKHAPHKRPSWDATFLQIAHDIAKRSPDSETQCGAVIVDKNKHILSVGYNGWMPGIDDSLIPNIRPDKHTWVIHAELNALLNCEHRPRGATIYVTHEPCLSCFSNCVIAGIAEVVYVNDSRLTTNSQGRETEMEVAQFLVRDRVCVRRVDFTPLS